MHPSWLEVVLNKKFIGWRVASEDKYGTIVSIQIHRTHVSIVLQEYDEFKPLVIQGSSEVMYIHENEVYIVDPNHGRVRIHRFGFS